MISDPKLPFASDSTGVGQLKSPETRIASELRPVSGMTSAEPPPSNPPSLLRLWLRRVAVLMFVFVCATMGVMLMILPWRPEWSDNPLLLSYPTLRALLSSGFARGAATGLGVLNVWIGFWEAIQYQE